jgi:hypothetical protein
MADKSLKNQAEEIIVAVDRDLQKVDSKAMTVQKDVDKKANALMDRIFSSVSDVDIQAASERVRALKEVHPDASQEELSQRLIREKCQKTGAVGAITSGAGLIPGIGTAAAATLGVAADIGATFKLQAELVLELAALYDYPLTEEEKQRVVLFITGLSAGTTTLARKAGERAALKISEKLAEKTIVKALPIVGVIASAGTNVLSTYIIGQRADAYFRLGPEAVGSWQDSLRAVTGVDERKIGGWLAESGRVTGAALVSGANKVGEAGKSAGEAVTSGAGKLAGSVRPALSSGATKAGQTARTGFITYVHWMIAFYGTIFRAIWAVLTFIPRQVTKLFNRDKKPPQNQE